MKTKIALYPLCAQSLPFVKYFDKLQDHYELVKAIALPGMALSEKDVAHLRKHPPVGIHLAEQIDLADSSWDMLAFIDSELIEDDKVAAILQEAIVQGKTVACYNDGTHRENPIIAKVASDYPGRVVSYAGHDGIHEAAQLMIDIHSIEAPIMLIGGLVKDADTTEVLLSLLERLRAEGQHPMGITRHALGEVFGLHSISHIFNDRRLTENEKILAINGAIKVWELEERPDVILIEAPDAMMRYDGNVLDDFGIYTYMLSQAISLDYIVVCIPYNLAAGVLMEALSEGFEHRFGAPIQAVHVSNLLIDAPDMTQTRKASYVHLDLAKVHEKLMSEEVRNSAIPMYDMVGDGIAGFYEQLRSL